jgi:uncharacterized membrane protein HdeD (DUF308 family)
MSSSAAVACNGDAGACTPADPGRIKGRRPSMSGANGTLGQRLLDGVKKHAGTAVAVGILLIIMGILSIAAPFVTGISVMVMVGVLMIISGLGVCLLAFQVGAFGAGLAWFLVGLLTLIAGWMVTSSPVAALAGMTLLLAGYFIVSGVVELFAAFGARPTQGWGWMAVSAVVTLLLGIMLWRQFPISGIWAIGTLFGFKLLFTGTSVLTLGMAVRKGVKGVETALKS